MPQAPQSMETFKMRPSDVALAIHYMRNTGIAMFLWGPPGISKSATGQQEATKAGIAFIDIRLSQMDPTDLRGIPYPTFENGMHAVRWSAPVALPRDLDYDQVSEIEATETTIRFSNPLGVNKIRYCTKYDVTVKALGKGVTAEVVSKGEDRFVVVLKDAAGEVVGGKVHWTVTGKCRAILALEEFNSAPPSVQAAAYQLVLDKKLGEYEVPELVWIMAMGNRDTDKGVTYKMGTAISNRYCHVEMTVNFEDWQNWALQNMVHPDVVSYLTQFQSHIFDFNPGTASRGFATPRSWAFVSEILSKNDDIPAMVKIGLVFGCIGEGIGAQFIEHSKHTANLPPVDKILSGELKKLPANSAITDERGTMSVALSYALQTQLCYQLKQRADEVKRQGGNWMASKAMDKWFEEGNNFIAFMLDNFKPEMSIMATKIAIQVHKLPFNTQKQPRFNDFAKRNKEFIMG